MNQKKTVVGILFVVVFAIAGVFVWEKRGNQIFSKNQQSSSNQVQADIQNNTQVKSDEAPLAQHITAIPGSNQVWYEVPEIGIKLLVSKEAAEEILYRHRAIDDRGSDSTKRVASVSFFSKKIIAFDVALGLSETWDDLYVVQKYLGMYTGETLCCGVKFLKQFDGFYLTDGGSHQALLYTEEEQKKFNDSVTPILPKFPRLADIYIESL